MGFGWSDGSSPRTLHQSNSPFPLPAIEGKIMFKKQDQSRHRYRNKSETRDRSSDYFEIETKRKGLLKIFKIEEDPMKTIKNC